MVLRIYKKEDAPIIAEWLRSEEELYKWSADRFNKYPLSGKDINENYAPQIETGRFIPQLIKEGKYNIEDDAIGIIYPVYGLTAPEIVKRYIKDCHLKAAYIFVIGTYGNADGATLHVMKKLLESNGNRADYFETLLMVDNYLPGFEMRDQVSRLEEKGTERELARIVDEVNGRIKKYNDRGFGWKLASAALNSAYGGVVKNRAKKWFSVNEDCIGCGICSRVCPVANVTQTDKSKPVFGGNCECCFACVHNCPKKAIHLKNEKSGERFRNPAVSVNEIIAANRQG